jgi:hypothetical protein
MSVTVTLERNLSVKDAKFKMLKIAFSHPLVMKSPRPVILLTEFDSYYNLMTFEVHFWLQMTSFTRCEVVKSEILETITEAIPTAVETKAPSEKSDSDDQGNEQGAERPSSTISHASSEQAPDDPVLLRALKRIGRAAIERELKRLPGAH